MHKSPPSSLSWLAVFCAVLSMGLLGWSRLLPEASWETSTAGPHFIQPIELPSYAIVEANPSMDLPTAETTAANPTTAAPVSTAPVSTPPAETSVPSTPASTPPALADAPSPSAPAIDNSQVPTASQPSPTPLPSDATLAGPLPTRSTAGEPINAPTLQTSSTTASIPPTLLGITDIAKQPHLWPRQVILLSAARFAVIIKGMNAGNVLVPAGRPVTLRNVNLDGTVEVEMQGSLTKVKAQETDLVPRVNAAAAAREKAAAFGPPPPLAPSSKSIPPSDTVPTL